MLPLSYTELGLTNARDMAAASRTDVQQQTSSSERPEAGGMGSGCLRRLAGTYLAPCSSLPMPSWPAVEQMARSRLTALAASPDFLALDKVAAVLRARYAQVVWVRLHMADADPGATLATLLGTTAQLEEPDGIAEVVAGHARLGEWRIAYQMLARWLAAATVSPAVLV